MSPPATPFQFLLALWWAAMAFAAALAPLVAAAQPAGQERRIALVIGNNAYETSPLVNSVNDARAMAEVLRGAGFAVMLYTDADQRQMQLALREFGERLKLGGGSGTGLFYFAGHGMQIKGKNFLIPVRSNIEHEDEVGYAALDAQSVLDKMESAGNGTNIVILDACRNNPFARSFRSAQQGLAQMDASVGTLVAFATAPGSLAIDSQVGLRNGLYTTHLLEALRRPGLKVEDVFKQVRQGVLRASANKQVPWEASALVGDFYFHPPPAAAALTAPTPPAALAPSAPAAPAIDAQAAIDDALWAAVKDSRSSAELFAYLNRFPGGRNARDARRRLLDLAVPAAPAAPSTAAVTGASVAAAAAAIDTAASLRVEEVTRWGQIGTDRRPAEPKRNSVGFAEGDRFRYVKTDFFGSGSVTNYVWNVDRLDEGGKLWVNGGRQRLDPHGQRLSGNDEHTGVWLEFSPPLPVAEAAQRGAGHVQIVKTVVQVRDGAGRMEYLELNGTLRTEADAVRGPRGTTDLLPAVRVDVELSGWGTLGDGLRRQVQWQHKYWMAAPLLLPVAFEVLEIVDGLHRQRTRHELVAVDQLSHAVATPGR